MTNWWWTGWALIDLDEVVAVTTNNYVTELNTIHLKNGSIIRAKDIKSDHNEFYDIAKRLMKEPKEPDGGKKVNAKPATDAKMVAVGKSIPLTNDQRIWSLAQLLAKGIRPIGSTQADVNSAKERLSRAGIMIPDTQ